MAKAIFYDPQLKRWRRLRRVLDVVGVVITVVIAVFLFTALRSEAMPELLLPGTKHSYRTIKEHDHRGSGRRGTHRRTTKPPSQVILNEESIRAAFYVMWDAGSYSSLRDYLNQIKANE